MEGGGGEEETGRRQVDAADKRASEESTSND